MDKIIINSLEVYAYHGVLPEEKKNGQNFFVTAELNMDLRMAGNSDNLTDTINYDEASKLIYEAMTEERFDLIEAAAEHVAVRLLLKYDMLSEVMVRIDKPHAPVDLKFDSMSVQIVRKRHKAFLGIGSNLGDRREYLDFAVTQLRLDDYIKVIKVSDYIETEPYGPVEQPDFLNGAVLIETLYSPEELLSVVNDIENEAGRERIIHWGPRTLDIDILIYDKEIITTDKLIIPHKEMHKRYFVLKPMVELAPFLKHPVLGKTMTELLSGVSDDSKEDIVSFDISRYKEEDELYADENTKVVYAGVPGAYAEDAAVKYFGKNVKYTNVSDFSDVVSMVADDEADYGVIPIENSSAGFVTGNYDIIRTGKVKIAAHVTLDIHHCIAAINGATLEDIKKVYSHPQGLMQCKEYIDSHGFKAVSASNTARAAERVMEEGRKDIAAISSERAAGLYGLNILERNINFASENSTKFVILTKKRVFLSNSINISVCFTTQHKVGALYEVLGIIDKAKLNMTSIESRPSLKHKWEYWFYVTFEGKLKDRNVIRTLSELKANTDEFIVLGTY